MAEQHRYRNKKDGKVRTYPRPMPNLEQSKHYEKVDPTKGKAADKPEGS